ncbi:hypothetical protein [Pseudomonas luteola]|uniref:Uncharacterized protein n=1 Tax=Pseudomonas luteola TaxID=47886 RepID=A0ABS0MV80_PSELU|nr:hypothetical protein [Pseudomonas luteola]MBH3440501.1 hypothetical protein [Pseudomonas luteola]
MAFAVFSGAGFKGSSGHWSGSLGSSNGRPASSPKISTPERLYLSSSTISRSGPEYAVSQASSGSHRLFLTCLELSKASGVEGIIDAFSLSLLVQGEAQLSSENATEYAKVTIMSSFRKDLFVSVTLPLLALGITLFGVSAGAYVYAYNVSNDASDDIKDLRLEAQKDRDLLSQRLEIMRKETEDGRRSSEQKFDVVISQLNKLTTSMAVLESRINTEK